VAWICVKRFGYYPACAFIGVLLLLSIPPLVRLFSSNLETGGKPLAHNDETKNAKIVVLISEFAGKDPEGYGVTDIVFHQLADALDGYHDVKIARITDTIETSETAQAKAKEEQADIVLWGSYLTNQAQTWVTVHFEVIDKSFDIPLRQDREIISAATAKLESFVIQEELSREMGYLVLLTAGLVRLESADTGGAIESFTKALSLSEGPEQIIEPPYLRLSRNLLSLEKGV
jgi:hypothetical protein